jgi:hypothetical protein
VGDIVGDIKKFATDFRTCSFKHFCRLLNVPAHVLARSSEARLCNIYVNVIPDAIKNELCNDVAYSIKCQHSLKKKHSSKIFIG